MRTIVLPVAPVAKPRMTRRDQWAKRSVVLAYWAFKDRLIKAAGDAGFTIPPSGTSVVFYVGTPASWSRKKRLEMESQPHLPTPDLDNFLKAYQDSLAANDSAIWQYKGLEKRWSTTPRIEVTIHE